jgi:curved DNA-binding protein CbpA
MAEPTHYETLGIAPGATAADIKKAFRTLAKKFHPDRNKGQKFAERKFKEINHAYETLKDPESRARYDRTLTGEPDSADAEEYEAPKWEPTAEQLQAIYRLDDDERDREIERLCGLHPHLKEFFKERPPPPRFYPSDAYMADFWTRDAAWRQSEIERLSAAHPHLRRWFAAGGKKKRQSRDRRNNPGRGAGLDGHLIAEWLFRIVIGISGGGIAGFAIGYGPSWVVSQVAGSIWGDQVAPPVFGLLRIGFILLGVRAGVMLSNLVTLPRFVRRERANLRPKRLLFAVSGMVLAGLLLTFAVRPSLGSGLVHGVQSLFQASKISSDAGAAEPRFSMDATGAVAAEPRVPMDATVNTENLYLRTGPGSRFDKVTVMPRGCRVRITGSDINGWLPVEARCDPDETVHGYASGRYLSR